MFFRMFFLFAFFCKVFFSQEVHYFLHFFFGKGLYIFGIGVFVFASFFLQECSFRYRFFFQRILCWVVKEFFRQFLFCNGLFLCLFVPRCYVFVCFLQCFFGLFNLQVFFFLQWVLSFFSKGSVFLHAFGLVLFLLSLGFVLLFFCLFFFVFL